MTTAVATKAIGIDQLQLGDVVQHHNQRWILVGIQVDEFGICPGRELHLKNDQAELVEFFSLMDLLTIEL